ncbi:hypothetical protein AArcMg_0474 [Natrarchaeobaculum sulfurireducens]|uniref:Uncharacterized protein n=1 Tax=Natrarchaeobaculum sulfurireducens TaxID=2044521 RepID=A0A346PBD4_9EURY|nr:hypothetical protein AArc1_0485 [Natrarchaeobaculum sulfurireducens]AXR80497.1 hypothetical protein AArcMg_0474 [Natrarchaeobaculum sulfurireducens]
MGMVVRHGRNFPSTGLAALSVRPTATKWFRGLRNRRRTLAFPHDSTAPSANAPSTKHNTPDRRHLPPPCEGEVFHHPPYITIFYTL